MSSRFSLSRTAQPMCSGFLRVYCILTAAICVNILHSAVGVRARVFAEIWSSTDHADRGAIQINLRGKPFITYSFRDPEILRPYFANAFAPSGAKITRNHPPAADDPQDHDKMHPGMWLAFGDLSGADSWRLAAPIEHIRFVSPPRTMKGTLKFAVQNRYMPTDGQSEICRDVCNYTLVDLPNGVIVHWDSVFQSDDRNFVFGDQEELGVGVRLAKTVAVKSGLGGRILNSNGQRNEKEAWGQQADWCDYSGTVGNEFVGIMIMPHPANFRRAWCHSRDSGFMAMNPFGRNAFTGKEKSAVVVQAKEPFRLRYAVLFHWNDRPQDFNPERAYREYLKSIPK
jgi:hypothetical protein